MGLGDYLKEHAGDDIALEALGEFATLQKRISGLEPSIKEQALGELGGIEGLTRPQQEKLAGVHIAEKAERLDYMRRLPPESPEKEAWFKGWRRRYNDETFTVMGNVKTEQDLDELTRNREAYEAQGVNVREIIRYFTEEK
jgi:hypothetical protein